MLKADLSVRLLPDTELTMYDVIYVDPQGSETPVALHLVDKQDAASIARKASAERGCGRMILPGSAKVPDTVYVVPTDDLPDAA